MSIFKQKMDQPGLIHFYIRSSFRWRTDSSLCSRL